MDRSRSRPVAVSELVGGLHLGPRQSHKALCLWPLLRAQEATPPPEDAPCAALADALEDGFVGAEELDACGPRPALRVQNRAVTAVLVLSGEALEGLGRRRVALASFLVPARGEVVIDAACLGSGRLGRRPRELAEMVDAFHAIDRQVGFVAALGEQVVGLEAIGSPGLFARVFPSLLEPYALDAVDPLWAGAGSGLDAPEPLLAGLRGARVWSAGGRVGLGEHLRIRGEAVEGSALAFAGGLVHLRALPTGRGPARRAARR